VLAGLSEVRVLTHYRLNGETVHEYPYDWKSATGIQPVYTTLSGWEVGDLKQAIDGQDFGALPAELQAYVRFVAAALDVNVIGLGLGRDRADTIFIAHDIRSTRGVDTTANLEAGHGEQGYA
jgi:adenylosuccinate synthase